MPRHWVKFKMAKETSVTRLITDLNTRLQQLQAIASSPDAADGVWLGGLFRPEAYITATRQAVAHKNGGSLEQLVLQLGIESSQTLDAFTVRGKSLGWTGAAKGPRLTCQASNLKALYGPSPGSRSMMDDRPLWARASLCGRGSMLARSLRPRSTCLFT